MVETQVYSLAVGRLSVLYDDDLYLPEVHKGFVWIEEGYAGDGL